MSNDKRIFSPEEHGVLNAQFVPGAGGVRVQIEEPNPWVFVCREHFNYEPEQKTVGIPGSKPCHVCGRLLEQGPGTVTIRRDSVTPRVLPDFDQNWYPVSRRVTYEPAGVIVEEPVDIAFDRKAPGPMSKPAPTKEELAEVFAWLDALPGPTLGPGPHTAEEDEHGAVYVKDKNGVARCFMPKAVYEAILRYKLKKGTGA